MRKRLYNRDKKKNWELFVKRCKIAPISLEALR